MRTSITGMHISNILKNHTTLLKSWFFSHIFLANQPHIPAFKLYITRSSSLCNFPLFLTVCCIPYSIASLLGHHSFHELEYNYSYNDFKPLLHLKLFKFGIKYQSYRDTAKILTEVTEFCILIVRLFVLTNRNAK